MARQTNSLLLQILRLFFIPTGDVLFALTLSNEYFFPFYRESETLQQILLIKQELFHGLIFLNLLAKANKIADKAIPPIDLSPREL